MASRKSAKAGAKRSAAATSTAKKSAGRSGTSPARRWSAKVKTDSTKPEPGLFKKSGQAIVKGLAKKSVSPEGPGQAVRMLNFYENRGGRNLSSERKSALETAKRLLHRKVEAKSAAKAPATTKSPAKGRTAKKASAKKVSR